MPKNNLQCVMCGRCCTGTIVPLNDSDLRRLVCASGLPAHRIVRLYSAAEIEIEADSELWIRMKYGRRILGLRHRAGRCLFLDEKNRCRAYRGRPSTCRTYPYSIDLDENGEPERLDFNSRVRCKARVAIGDRERLLRDARREDIEDRAYAKRLRGLERKGIGGKQGLLAALGFTGSST